ncbi:CDP-glucose 4,6-dehydratase [Streptosporangium sp. NPDC004631]
MADYRLDMLAGKRILITGHSGFLGSWLAGMAVGLGASVTGYSLSARTVEAERAAWLALIGVGNIDGDVRDYRALLGAAGRDGCDLIIHLAAQPIVLAGYEDPRGTLEVNINGTINVLEAARIARPRGVIVLSSDKCYRNQSWRWPYREVDELGGGCPYSASKAAAELVLEAYAGLYRAGPDDLGAASVRLGNLVGGGDFADRLVPNCLRSFAAGLPVRLRDSTAVRPWQHVLDVAHGILLLAVAMLGGRVPAGEAYNFAPPYEGASVRELTEELARAWGGVTISGEDQPGPFHEERTLRLDGRKAAEELGWEHRFDLSRTVLEVVEWHRGVERGVSPAEMTTTQINRFLVGLGRPASAPGFVPARVGDSMPARRRRPRATRR